MSKHLGIGGLLVIVITIFLLNHVAGQIVCDSGDLASLCVISSLQSTSQSTNIYGNALLITQQGGLTCSVLSCTLQFNLESTITVEGKIASALINITSPSVVISPTGKLDTSGLGFVVGPGTGTANQGASYGAWSSYSDCEGNAVNKLTYGSVKAPNAFGSGGNDVNGTATNGGGFVLIYSTGQIDVSGQILSNGRNGTLLGGSGGSVWVTASQVIGNGSVSANGGSASSPGSGGGSGGRISISSIPSTLRVSAVGGWSGDRCSIGGSGTIYDSTYGSLYIIGPSSDVDTDYIGQSVLPQESYTNILLRNVVGSVLSITCDSLDIYSSDIVSGCTSSCSVVVALDTLSVDDDSEFDMPRDTLVITANTINHSGKISAQKINITSYTLTVSGSISADENGYPANSGPGAGFNGASYGGGGSYGGYSVISCLTNNVSSGTPYGSITAPSDMGSGGGNTGGWFGGAGGGVVSISVQQLILEGSITSNGGDGNGAAGGGSGGTVVIVASSMDGSGYITADGGKSGHVVGGLGSGGRIVLPYYTSTSLTVSASGQSSNGCTSPSLANRAGGGTIYSSLFNTLFVNNGPAPNVLLDGSTPIPKSFYGDVSVTSAIIFAPDYTINVTSFSLASGAVFTCGQCQTEGLITSTSIKIDASSQFILNKWWEFNSTNMDLYGIVYGSGIVFVVQNLNIFGGVNTDGQGFGPGLGPGKGASGDVDSPGGGAGHGSNGMQSCGIAEGGDSYDIPTNPTVFGSGGGNSGLLLGGSGGGAILIRSSTFYFYGYLSANGVAGVGDTQQSERDAQQSESVLAHSGSGGGSGGSINIKTNYFILGNASYITSNGGDGGVSSLSGGGGAGGVIFFNISNFAWEGVLKPNVTTKGGMTACKSNVANGIVTNLCTPGFSAVNTFICTSCSYGNYSSDGVKCLQCPVGTYSNQLGSKQCTQCSPGYYNGVPGASSCNQCYYQTYANSSGQSSCTPCSPGYVSDKLGATQCSACGPGTYASTIYYRCYSCSAGTFSNQTANAVCSYCGQGSTSSPGASSCNLCTPGTYCEYSGCNMCFQCYYGSYTNVSGSSTCTLCPIYSYAPLMGTVNCLYCPTAYYPGSSYCQASISTSTGRNNHTLTTSYTMTTMYTSYSSYSNTGGGGGSSDGLTPLDTFFISVFSFFFICGTCACCCYHCKRQQRQYEPIASPTTSAPRPMPQPPNPYPPPPNPNLPPVPPPRANPGLSSAESDSRNQECIICYDAKRETVMLPCGHITACEKCTRTLLETRPMCPICRKPIASFVRMFSA